jgi:uncharacterized membrane protein YphA (DoxX/SURF4 family)
MGSIEWIFRIAVAMEFVGHGAFGLKTKAAWVPYFGVVGIPESWAWRLMPVVGALDVTVGLLMLVVPIRVVLLHMTCWGLMTAALRPLAGQGIWEMLERGYNYGVPLAFLLMVGVSAPAREWFRPVDVQLTPARCRAAALALRWAIGLSVIGHGGIALFTHDRWTVYLTVIGFAPVPALTALHAVAGLELALGLAVLVGPSTGLLAFVCVWKIATEALRIPAGEPIWEFIERGGAYAAPVLLILLQTPGLRHTDERAYATHI